ncbi:tRNA (adenosine(37)-N6)-dimethylallyltransferase MiaA [Moraxella sp.]|uniref:tRNA (adenosine(37)-N6)-dimethylallyltransferase MiaA n=1 Tax=Moraxella sp. TaxID=479 RepID=UPI0026DB410F|nr:tRNA (adenosine(37)-N6)-dimethylallyltransferase MiaA [Moraxella sp.]MDO4894358.1 tRNA (adenosine(37)-N6)-dimethylallyltransferase MiaA [Moraxella sp.]
MSLFYKNLPDNTVVCLMSPTASGKTDLAFRLYDTGRFELISVDSALIYQDMNIGTAKPTSDELISYPHHLVDIILPTQTYSVANFVQDTKQLIEKTHQNGKIPLLVGGTMMYYMALLDGISAVPQTNEQVREQVRVWRDDAGNAALYEYLQQHDPIFCQKFGVNDTQRITRAVEVHLQTGRSLSSWQQTPKTAISHDAKWQWYGLCVLPDRAWLHERIAQRLQMMWAGGFVEEVIELLKKYPTLTPDLPSMRCVGYRQVLDYLLVIRHESVQHFIQDNLQNQSSFDKHHILTNHDNHTEIFAKKITKISPQSVDLACQDMKNRALYATRQLAKRQYTWLRQLADINKPTINNLTIDLFDSIKEVEKQLLQV